MRQVATLSTLLALALGASYWTWRSPAAVTLAAEAVAIYPANPTELQSIEWAAEDLRILVSKKQDRLGEYTWITVDQTLPSTAPELPAEEPADDGSAGEEAPAAPAEPARSEPEHQIVAFVGNDAAEKLWENLAPLTALRRLEVADPASAAFGLATPAATLKVERRQGPVELAIGGTSFGTKDRYVRSQDRVFLVKASDLKPLEQASSRLVEKALFPLISTDVEQIEVQTDAQKRVFVQRNRDDRSAAYWASSDTPDQANDMAGTWLTKLFRVRVQSYETEAPTLEPVMTYSVLGKDQRWSVQLLRTTGDAPTEYYARSAYNRSLVKLTKDLAQEVVDDLHAVLDAE